MSSLLRKRRGCDLWHLLSWLFNAWQLAAAVCYGAVTNESLQQELTRKQEMITLLQKKTMKTTGNIKWVFSYSQTRILRLESSLDFWSHWMNWLGESKYHIWEYVRISPLMLPYMLPALTETVYHPGVFGPTDPNSSFTDSALFFALAI